MDAIHGLQQEGITINFSSLREKFEEKCMALFLMIMSKNG